MPVFLATGARQKNRQLVGLETFMPLHLSLVMRYKGSNCPKRLQQDTESLFEQNTTVNDKSTAGRFDPKVFVNCVQDKE